jgi:hypothetical protein
VKAGELIDAKRRALNIFDAWNQVTGALEPGSSCWYEMQSVIEDAVDCGAQAATGNFRRLDGEEGPIAGFKDAPQVATFTSGLDAYVEFKNFHRLLCERFGYSHDPVDWRRDQLSLIEHIASQASDEAES